MLWAVKNGPGRCTAGVGRYKGAPATTTAGTRAKALHYPDGTGDLDSEGVTLTGAGPAGGVFVSTERNNGNSGVSRPEVLRFDPVGTATSLTATKEWNLTCGPAGGGREQRAGGDLLDPRLVPDLAGFLDEHTGAAYNPGAYPGHGDGLFFVGLEANGTDLRLRARPDRRGFTRVATIASGFPGVMDLEFDPETNRLWAVCDDTCNGRTATSTSTPAGSSPSPACTSGRARCPTSTTRDSRRAAVGVRGRPQARLLVRRQQPTGTRCARAPLDCTVPPAQQEVYFTSSPPAAPVVGQTWTVTTAGGGSGNPVVLSIADGSASVCSLTGSTVAFDHAGSCVVEARRATRRTRTATRRPPSRSAGRPPPPQSRSRRRAHGDRGSRRAGRGCADRLGPFWSGAPRSGPPTSSTASRRCPTPCPPDRRRR